MILLNWNSIHDLTGRSLGVAPIKDTNEADVIILGGNCQITVYRGQVDYIYKQIAQINDLVLQGATVVEINCDFEIVDSN